MAKWQGISSTSATGVATCAQVCWIGTIAASMPTTVLGAAITYRNVLVVVAMMFSAAPVSSAMPMAARCWFVAIAPRPGATVALHSTAPTFAKKHKASTATAAVEMPASHAQLSVGVEQNSVVIAPKTGAHFAMNQNALLNAWIAL